jgi:hypothetical protein
MSRIYEALKRAEGLRAEPLRSQLQPTSTVAEPIPNFSHMLISAKGNLDSPVHYPSDEVCSLAWVRY